MGWQEGAVDGVVHRMQMVRREFRGEGRRRAFRSGHLFSLFTGLFLLVTCARADVVLYDDALKSGFQDWSWGSETHDLSSTSAVHAGTKAVAETYTGGWSGLQFGNASGVDVSAYDVLRFFVHGGAAGGQNVVVRVGDASSYVEAAVSPTVGAWAQVDVPLADLGVARSVTFVFWFNNTGGSQSAFSIDDVHFLSSGAPPPPPPPTGDGPVLAVNAATGLRAIDPNIYGINFADETLAAELVLPVRRWGGNSTTRYNWQLDTANRASDWYFENIPNENAHPELLPDGSETDLFVEQDLRTSTRTLLTMPLIGWMPKSRSYSCGFSVIQYGAQQSVDPWRTDCGNGISAGGAEITGNLATDTSVAIGTSFVTEWIAHLVAKYGNAAAGGVAFYNLDNEPMLWNSTHRDLHPSPTSYDEMRDRTWLYGAAIKGADPTAKTLGPAEWGWTGYFWSALDMDAGDAWWLSPADRNAHGGTPFIAWYLQQMKVWETANGTRILDYLDLHDYPQSSGVALSPAGNASIQALRLRSTRSLWDPSYTDESWISDTVELIPRMHEWIETNYPGTKIAISEYNWGALNHINGALAQADVLGIFGREGVDLAALWGAPKSDDPAAFAFRIYRNYDGAGSTFGDTRVDAISSDQSQLAIYAALRSSDNALTIVVVNKATQPLASSIALSGYEGATSARWYLYSASNLTAIVPEGDLAVSSGTIHAAFPASSISLVVLVDGSSPAACAPAPLIPCTNAVAGRSKIKIASRAGVSSLGWKWVGAAAGSLADFGDPTAGGSWTLCLYANGALASAAVLPSSSSCGSATCWKASATTLRYSNSKSAPWGISRASIRVGDVPSVTLKQGGPVMPDPGLPLLTPVVVQMVRSDGSACWQASYSTAKSSSTSFQAASD